MADLDDDASVTASASPSSTKPEFKSHELVELDPDGDITLNIKNGADHRSFRISSQPMRLASPVWKAMLTGGFAESRKTTISLEDDDAETLLIILRIVHHQNCQVPKELTFDQIAKLAVVCDKYDTVTLVRPFLHLWLPPYEGDYLGPGHEQWLFVAWIFGYKEDFIGIANHLTRTVNMDIEGCCPNADRQILGELLPTDLLDNVMKIRIEAIDKILALCYAEIDTVMNGTMCPFSEGTDEERTVCQQFRLGSLIFAFKSMEIWPPKTSSAQVRCSVSDLRDTWKSSQHFTLIRVSDSPSRQGIDAADNPTFTFLSSARTDEHSRPNTYYGRYPRQWHNSCLLKTAMLNSIQDIIDSMPSPVQEAHLRHIEEQAAK